MLAHYIRHAARLLAKQRLHAFINVLGLATALGLCMLIALFVKVEHTFDSWHERLDRIYRVDRVDFNPDGSVDAQGPSQPFPFAAALKADHPDVEETARFNQSDLVIRHQNVLLETEVMFADPSVFDILSFQATDGSLEGALTDPTAVVLTRSAARRLLGTEHAVGQTLDVRFTDSFEPATVTAVVEDLPPNTNVPFEVLMSFERTPQVFPWVARRVDDWRSSSFNVFVLMRDGVDMDAASATLRSLRTRYYPDLAEQGREAGWWTGDGEPSTYAFVPLRDLHLRSDVAGGFVPTSDPQYSLILMGIGLLILALACINFMLLTMGRSSVRAEEIGVRKALGAGRLEIVKQFGGESILMSILGLAGGLVLATLLLPAASSLSGRELGFEGNLDVVLAMVVVAIAAGLAAGSYPSLVISRHRPVDALRGRFSLAGANALSRGLLVTQFAASVALAAGALVMQSQLKHLQTRDLGYDPANVIVVHANQTDGQALVRHLRNAMASSPGVTGVSGMSLSLNRGYSSTSWMVDGVEKETYVYNVDPHLPQVLEMDLVAGRSFDTARADDSTQAVVVNEAFTRDWGWTPLEAIGKRVLEYGEEPVIVGVVRDLNFRSQHEEVLPMMMTVSDSWISYALVRASAESTPPVLDKLQTAWTEFAPDVPLEYTFLDSDVALAYREDRRWSQMVGLSAGIAILVACMGLFGLAALTVSRRTKEIGIRKVLGASVSDVTVLVSREFAILVVVATLIAAPMAWLGLERWLGSFAYRIELSPWMFGLAGFAVLVIAMTTVGFHSVRAAVSDPVKALRYE